MRPVAIPARIRKCWDSAENTAKLCHTISKNYDVLLKGAPDVSIVIPAYNEADNILGTLLSLTGNVTAKSVEIIVVNNNSSDNTKQLALAAGVRCIDEKKQGITNARNKGLAHANGAFILNADADTIYPVDWIEEMIRPLVTNTDVAITYGRFSFIPVGKTSRFTYFFYEHIADFTRWMNKYIKDEAVNVYGFNSGFRREQGIQVEGFVHPPGSNEDGWLALKLRNKGFGKLHYVNNSRALVWTSDRRSQIDGGFFKASGKRVKRIFFGKEK